jgi:phosphatidylserine decarboxylase
MPSAATRVAAETLRLLPRKRLSRALGRIAATPGGGTVLRQAIDLYVRAYGVDLSEAEIPHGGFRTFDEFFTRHLKPDARPIENDPGALVSPADGRVEDVGPIEPGARLHVKGQEYDVGELLGEPSEAQRFEGGTFAVVYLSPRDYHRVHSPVDGPIHTVRHVGGTLLPVNAFGVASYPQLFARNERVAFFQESERHGEVATVMVGAIGVGRISVSFDPSIMTNVGRGPVTHRYAPTPSGLNSESLREPSGLNSESLREPSGLNSESLREPSGPNSECAPRLARGDELGTFHLGSTVVVLTRADCRIELRVSAGDRIRMGRALAVATR